MRSYFYYWTCVVLLLLVGVWNTDGGGGGGGGGNSNNGGPEKVTSRVSTPPLPPPETQQPNFNNELPITSGGGGSPAQQPDTTKHNKARRPSSTELTTDPLRDLLVISTLDGTLTAVDRISGEVRWVAKDDKPIIQVPPTPGHPPSHVFDTPPPSTSQENTDGNNNSQQQQQRLPRAPYFLPDPKTGSLYMMGKQNSLRKLPFTIPQLVTMAPCKNSEGLMYTGKKLDVWVHLNPHTGEKFELPFESDQFNLHEDLWTCPAASYSKQPDHCKESSSNPFIKSILIGKTEYTLSMMDGGTRRRWNVTYNHYSSKDMSAQGLQDYELVHFTSPSEGHMITYDRSTGELRWSTDLSSPVIGLYSIEAHTANLISVPFNPIATDTLERLKSERTSSNKALSPTTYVGECAYGLYAVPTLADENVLVIGEGSKLPPLIAGPLSGSGPGGSGEQGTQEPSSTVNTDYLLLGYYEVTEATTSSTARIEGVGDVPSSNVPSNESMVGGSGAQPEDGKVIIPPPSDHRPVLVPSDNITPPQDPIRHPSQHQSLPTDRTPNIVTFPPPPTKRTKEIKIVVTTSIISIAITASVMGIIFVAYRRYKNNQLALQHKLLSGGGSSDSGTLGNYSSSDLKRLSGSNSSRTTSISSIDGTITDMTIGKITLFPGEVLGKGCEGTFVFKGKFEGRDVAVKRILPECFAFADREVDLLKESDQHANVIRYFCTETDGQFRYIALELCVATLSDWVEGRYENDKIEPISVLKEATEGLAHLHSLRIVHRDVKPANVLISLSVNGVIRTLISDFGLCKKIQNGRMSYSRRSGGVPGTDGWIAREVLCFIGEDGGFMMTEGGGGGGAGDAVGRTRMTYSVDIFSMGCVYYYVLTRGSHPFGDAFRRQSNILTGEFDLTKISNNPRGAEHLIRSMISMDPNDRPPFSAVLTHPVFWSNDKALGFFLDVSDRIEKESEDTFPLLRRVEAGAAPIVKTDWRDHICAHVAMDLRRYRTYKGQSIRDLLRALRNKKNHYRELTIEAQESLGNIPDQFVNYWVDRFPALLPYTWAHFEVLKHETVFAKYYPGTFDFYELLLLPEQRGDDDEEEDEREGDEERHGGGGGGGSSSTTTPENAQAGKQLGKDFWRSKSQARYQRWRGRGGGGGGPNHRSSPRRTNNTNFGGSNGGEDGGGGGDNNHNPHNNTPPSPPKNLTAELSASTDNYWRSKSPNRRPE